MRYVPFGELGFDISRLGFGAMRLPMIREGESERADVPRGVALLRRAMDGGVTYLDTAYPYMNGESERIVGLAVKDGYREKVKIATKLPCWAVETRQDMDKLLDEQLKKLDVAYVDFYLLHALNKDRWQKMKALGVLEFLDSAVADGRIRYPGFSFHDEYKVFKTIIDSYDWRMAQIQYNYLDLYKNPGRSGLRRAKERGVQLVVMEPLRGGALTSPPPEVQTLLDRYPVKKSAVEWAFRFVGNETQVPVILSGMSDETQVDDNLRIFDALQMNAADESEKRLYTRMRQAYYKRMPIGCTGCAYCIPCPKEVRIPRIFRAYNEAAMFDRPEQFKRQYAEFIKNGHDGGQCVQCGLCETKCPQKLPIRELLKTAHEAAAEGK